MLERVPTGIWGTTHHQRFTVAYGYPIVFTRDAFDPDNPTLADLLRQLEPSKRHRLAIFVDAGVAETLPSLEREIHQYAAVHAGLIEIVGEVLAIKGGESLKNDPAALQSLLEALAVRRIDRHSYALAVGGGAVLDVVGYAAAIFHRGVRHIRFPTTVLAQCDSGVGVKNAVNAFGLKNLIGAFAPPAAVINDGSFIDCLPDREKRSGLAEAVKVALIRDADFYTWIEGNGRALRGFDPDRLDVLIEWSAVLHMRQIAGGGDPFETGSSRPLDFGHWSAHKLEMATNHAVSHGEAVAIGVAIDTRLSVLAGFLPAGEDDRVCCLLEILGFALWHDALLRRDATGRLAILAGLRDFQEHLGGELTVTLLASIGKGIDVHAIDEAGVEDAIAWLHRRRSAAAARDWADGVTVIPVAHGD